ncbi:NINE protein [Arthrobacter sp. Sa2BUA2]|uniref:NINE protein n=1 Tax=Arthrobacter pullicola TaxID=2762224 RepID=A0ABR8YLZ7_9MICC|nr:TM2 domain-containing protein [Arthrobacter pullicola]MBD8045162.1 NINE protein [Arthrobacter pullicola]
MSMNQPPNQHPSEEGDDGTGAAPGPATHGASAAPPPPPYGRAPGEYGAQGPEGNDRQQGPGPAWNQQAQPGNGTQGQPPFPQGYPPQGTNPQGPPGGYYQSAPQGQYPPGYYYAVEPPKSRLAAGLLGIFLGGFGIHRFYLGYTSIGVVQIVVTVFTWGLGAVWGFVEGIMILAGAQTFRTDARGVPLRE